jgi:hypothetical protein
MRDDGGPAFPGTQTTNYRRRCKCGEFVEFDDVAHAGTTLRKLYKAFALMGYNASTKFCEEPSNKKAAWAAEDADAMLAEDREVRDEGK